MAPALAQKSPKACEVTVWKVKAGAGAACADGIQYRPDLSYVPAAKQEPTFGIAADDCRAT